MPWPTRVPGVSCHWASRRTRPGPSRPWPARWQTAASGSTPAATWTRRAVAGVQRRTLRLLFVTQVISGIGVAIGASVGALLAADMAGIGVSGLAQSAVVIGAALFAVPATAIVRRSGRRASLTLLYGTAAAGAIVVVLAAMAGSVPLLFGGFFLFGGASAAGYQARYAAVDLAPPLLRGRHLSIVVWATTIGAVAGPNLAPIAGTTLAPLGVPVLAAPFFFSALLLALAATVLMLTLRPDPMRVALSLHADTAVRCRSARRAQDPAHDDHEVVHRVDVDDVVAGAEVVERLAPARSAAAAAPGVQEVVHEAVARPAPCPASSPGGSTPPTGSAGRPSGRGAA
jgi:hypothetical protein